MNILAQVIQLPLFIPIILYVLGMIFLLVEIFMPGFGVFGVLGIISFLAGIVLRILSGGGVLEILLVIVVGVVLLIIAMNCTVKSAQSGRLSKSALILNQNAMPEGKTAGTNDYIFLIGKLGETTTLLRPVGKAIIDGQLFEVISENSDIIERGEKIIVTAVEGQRIIVEMAK